MLQRFGDLDIGELELEVADEVRRVVNKYRTNVMDEYCEPQVGYIVGGEPSVQDIDNKVEDAMYRDEKQITAVSIEKGENSHVKELIYDDLVEQLALISARPEPKLAVLSIHGSHRREVRFSDLPSEILLSIGGTNPYISSSENLLTPDERDMLEESGLPLFFGECPQFFVPSEYR